MLSQQPYPLSPQYTAAAQDSILSQKILTIERIIQAQLRANVRLTPQKA